MPPSSLPKTAYVLLWFPEPTETFIFSEVNTLRRLGLPIKVFTLYGERTHGLSREMRSPSGKAERLGTPLVTRALVDVRYWWKRDRHRTRRILKSVPLRHWGGLEKTGENLWALLCAFRLARRFEEEDIQHIHAPWACGPATAAWVASQLTGIPFSFTAHAWDIYPPDGALGEKMRDAAFVRTVSNYNVRYLARFVPGDRGKIQLTRVGVPLKTTGIAPVAMNPPYRLLALGRFVGKKGFDVLIRACRLLEDGGIPFRLVLAGAGPRGVVLKYLARRLGLQERISFPGFVPHPHVSELFSEADMFIMPSVIHASGDRDGIPTVIMEALLHRVPVIATDVSGIGELVEGEKTGLLVPQRDPEAIARAVRRMIEDRKSAIRMAEKGRAKVLAEFSPEKNHQEVLQLFRDHFSPLR